MSLCVTNEEYQEAIENLLKVSKPKQISISTYCVSDIKVFKPFIPYKTRAFVGLPRGLKQRDAFGYDELPNLFPSIAFRFSRFNHAKCIIFEYERGLSRAIIGSRNLRATGSHDISFVIGAPHSTWLLTHFESWWTEPLTLGSATNCWRDRIGRSLK